MARADPVSWLVVEPGWSVVDRDGNEVGRVKEVLGDEAADIFSGVAVATGLLGKKRLVPAERVTLIREGVIETDLAPDED
jgi:ribosomal 30S subunit maturation factor RimM